jgi:catechol 2,3-dioxygenase-like lactoylglutathione lyase family enzyme
MSSMQTNANCGAARPSATSVDTKLEVVVIPVADVDRSIRFYVGLGWRLDADFSTGDAWRIVQVTPPGSPCSVIFGKGVTDAVPGSTKGLFLVVDDIDAAREQLRQRGARVSEVFHFRGGTHVTGTERRVPGPGAEDGSYRSFVSFADPDGNAYLVQQVGPRLPGRGFSVDVASLTELLKDAENRHGDFEPTAPKHHWSDWYAAYIVARIRGRDPEDAVHEAGAHVEERLR